MHWKRLGIDLSKLKSIFNQAFRYVGKQDWFCLLHSRLPGVILNSKGETVMGNPGFRGLRRVDRRISSDEAEEILCKSDTGFLGLIGDNGYPYVVPLNYVYDVSARRIYFHSAREGHKLNALKANEKVCFTVVGKAKVLPDALSTAYESAIFFGRASLVEGAEKEDALWKLLRKYVLGTGKDAAGMSQSTEAVSEYLANNASRAVVVRIDVEHITGKKRD
jgi:nitroimidazol reductase NimA-like FMN-containing flavoprotein (pyridoxamine 5'-phosphate oxidase superfamily)